jgi:hypothetical protein
MKTFLLTLIFLSFMINQIIPQVAPVQGDVIINTFDPWYETQGGNREEFVVLVNRTNKIIQLNGYEVQTFAVDGTTQYSGYQWTTSYILQPYTFLLLSAPVTINGVARDFPLTNSVNGYWDNSGYIALRKQSPTLASDYIDIVKHQRGGPLFTGVPANSGLPINNLNAVNVGTLASYQLVTRGGISGDLNSLIYNFYDATDFTLQSETTTPIQNSGSSPLPVELTSFSAVVLKDKIKLNWKTETEVNNYGFEVERSTKQDARNGNWEKMGFVNGSGNSNSPKNYSYEDKNVNTGKYSYRLKQIDNDGKYEYSKVVEVYLNVPGKFELSQNYPNPFNPTTTIRFSILETGNVKLTLFNILGQEIRTLVNESKEAGVHTINFNASELNSGLYLYKLEANGLVQTRKMTLVK